MQTAEKKTVDINSLKLPSPPAIAVKLLNEVRKEDSSFEELSRIISSDPALTAKILSLVNSSFYALPYKVDSLEKAVSIIGVDALKNIALSFMIATNLMKSKEKGFDFMHFWRRSVTNAVTAEIFAKEISKKTDNTFVTALLMDIGVIILFISMPEEYQAVLDEKRICGRPLIECERKILGIDHQLIGSELLKKWGLPESIYLPIHYHHEPKFPQDLKDTVGILKVADLMSSFYHSDRGLDKLDRLRNYLQKEFGKPQEFTTQFIDTAAEKTLEALSAFDIDSGSMKPYSELLLEANEELGKLNRSYEQIVLQLRREKERAESLAMELKEANERLRTLAFRDGLTGLYNHRYFQEIMEREIKRAARYQRPLSLILIDIDHFKQINDTFGHQRGDQVLKTLGKIIENTIRTSDIAARYGGEEFAIILPETDLKGAAVLAERLRKAVESCPMDLNGTMTKITISLGVTTYMGGQKEVKKSKIIDAADRALYNSKEKGRNRVSLIALN